MQQIKFWEKLNSKMFGSDTQLEKKISYFEV